MQYARCPSREIHQQEDDRSTRMLLRRAHSAAHKPCGAHIFKTRGRCEKVCIPPWASDLDAISSSKSKALDLSLASLAMRSTAVLLTVTSLAASALAATYSLRDSFVGHSFLSGFSHEAIDDPTHGRV